MSKIITTYHPLTESFSFQEVDLMDHECDIVAGLDLHKFAIDLIDFSYGFDLRLPGGAVYVQRMWGETENMRFESTDQDVIEVSRVEWEPGLELTLRVWFQNNGQLYEGFHTFTTPTAPIDENPEVLE